MMITSIQIAWSLLGLFFGLLLIAPQSWFPTRTKLTQVMCLQMLIASLFGMMSNQRMAIIFAVISVSLMFVMFIRAVRLSIPGIHTTTKHYHHHHATKDKHS